MRTLTSFLAVAFSIGVVLSSPHAKAAELVWEPTTSLQSNRVSPAEEPWQAVYQSDFSTEPGWTTNSPQNFYWNQADGTYYFKRTNGAEQYAYKTIPFDPGASYELEFDVYMMRCDWAASHFLGLGDSDMSIQTATTWLVSYHKVDQGQTATLIYYDSEGGFYHPGGAQPAPFQLNTWYHNAAAYDRTAGTLSLRVTKVSDGSLVGEVELTSVGGFAGVDRLYMSSVTHVYATGAIAEGYIDNLVLREYSPAAEDIIYQSDFSTDPAWMTDQPSNYYWNQTAGTYHAKVENNAPGHRPNRYSYKAVTWTGDSLELKWDVKITRMDWSGGVCFGLFDEDLALGGFEGGQGVQLVFGHPDEDNREPSAPPGWGARSRPCVLGGSDYCEDLACHGMRVLAACQLDDADVFTELVQARAIELA